MESLKNVVVVTLNFIETANISSLLQIQILFKISKKMIGSIITGSLNQNYLMPLYNLIGQTPGIKSTKMNLIKKRKQKNLITIIINIKIRFNSNNKML